jgi:hypothetical protein
MFYYFYHIQEKSTSKPKKEDEKKRTSDGWKARGSENVIRERRMMGVRTPYGI